MSGTMQTSAEEPVQATCTDVELMLTLANGQKS